MVMRLLTDASIRRARRVPPCPLAGAANIGFGSPQLDENLAELIGRSIEANLIIPYPQLCVSLAPTLAFVYTVWHRTHE
jgi:hypothetical protein